MRMRFYIEGPYRKATVHVEVQKVRVGAIWAGIIGLMKVVACPFQESKGIDDLVVRRPPGVWELWLNCRLSHTSDFKKT